MYTFTLYQHFVDMSRYELDMLKRFDLACHLDGQPLQFMVRLSASFACNALTACSYARPCRGLLGKAYLRLSWHLSPCRPALQ